MQSIFCTNLTSIVEILGDRSVGCRGFHCAKSETGRFLWKLFNLLVAISGFSVQSILTAGEVKNKIIQSCIRMLSVMYGVLFCICLKNAQKSQKH